MKTYAWVGKGMMTLALALIAARASAQPTPLTLDRLRVQRQEVFAFAEPPAVARDGCAGRGRGPLAPE